MRRHDSTRGLSILEVLIAATLGAGVLGAGFMLTQTTTRAGTAAHQQSLVSTRVADAAEMIVRDLQVASLLAEDRNGNGTLDLGEDVNNNGALDADWSLSDGGSAASITFNRIERNWLWSAPVTYAVQNGVLVRTSNGVAREICRDITALSFTRAGTTVDVAISSEGRDGQGELWTQTAERRAYVRN